MDNITVDKNISLNCNRSILIKDQLDAVSDIYGHLNVIVLVHIFLRSIGNNIDCTSIEQRRR